MTKVRRKRRLATKRSVLVAERVSSALIAAGGIGTVGAIALIFVFLVSVVFPLFQQAEVGATRDVATQGALHDARHVLVDEYGGLVSVLGEDWVLRVVALETGNLLEELRPFAEGAKPTATSISVDGKSAVFGFADGTLHSARLEFVTSYPTEEETPEGLPEIAPGESVEREGWLYQTTPDGKLRRQGFQLEFLDELELSSSSPILRVAHVADENDAKYAVWTESEGLLLLEIGETTNFLTGAVEKSTAETQVAHARDEARGTPERMLMTGAGHELLLVWSDGWLERVDARDPENAQVAESLDLLPEDGDEITALSFLLGNYTLVIGSNHGAVTSWFGAKRDDAGTVDGKVFVRAHAFQGPDSPVVDVSSSARSRMLAAAYGDGTVESYYVTSALRLTRLEAPELGALHAVRVMPKQDGLLALGERGIQVWEVDFHHPEATLATFFRPIWYESFPEPTHSWQSEAATDDFEAKFGFMPLVFGTLKATFYSMIFGAPLAVLAALFTSEFLDRRLRIPIKSTIEMMASLPSVVLGFLAGIVIAPLVARLLPATIAAFITVPVVLLLGAHLWQLAPQRFTIKWSGWQRLLTMGLVLPLGVSAATVAGPALEMLFFGGNLELWLDGQVGSALGGWVFLTLPASALVVSLLGGRGYTSWINRKGTKWSRDTAALVDLGKYGCGLVAILGVALVLGLLLEVVGLDPRGSFVGTYDPRNALIVGFVMGFAIIPIIYSLVEDALASVPEHLRLASLGAGATPWQTAVRVIVPTAMSGIFSAVMIGLGRAVGETMIVLMAVGNTPIMDMNVFNGFRTLSANIATELPEAVKDSTHYRTLFFAALVLFSITFVLNTFAEWVRIRFRRRAYQL